MEAISICNLCEKPAAFSCGRCSDLYCSTACQKKDWPKHRHVCIPFPKLIPLSTQNQIRNDDAVSVIDAMPEIVPKVLQVKPTEPPKVTPDIVSLQENNVTKKKDEIPEKAITLKEAFKDHDKQFTQPQQKLMMPFTRPPLQVDQRNQANRGGGFQKRDDNQESRGDFQKRDQENREGFQKRDDNQENRGGFQNRGNFQKHDDQNNQENRSGFQRRDNNNAQENRGGFQKRDDNQENRGGFQNRGNFQKRDDQNNQEDRRPFQRQGPREKLEVAKPIIQEAPAKPKPKVHETTYKKHLPITCDLDDFFKVTVQYVCKSALGNFLYVTMAKYTEELDSFLEEVTKAHKSEDCVGKYYKYDDVDVGSLVVTPFDGKFLYRAEVIGKDDETNELKLRLIDFGNEFGMKDLKSLKIPQDFVYTKEMFSFEVQVDSLDDDVDIGSQLDIKIVPSELGRSKVQKAEIKKKDPAKDAKKMEAISEQTQKHLNATKSKIEEKMKAKIFVMEIETKKFPKGSFEASVLDLSMFMDHQLLTIAENSEDVTTFYANIQQKINEYLEGLKNCPGFYIPEPQEMVLAKFEGDFYRAVCLAVKDGKYELEYLDYGNMGNVAPEEMRKFPRELMLTACAHTCFVRNVDPKKIDDEITAKLQSGSVTVENATLTNGIYEINLKLD